MPPPLTIAQINWRRRVYIDGRGFANVYRVAKGIVAKVGAVREDEAQEQIKAANLGKAIPVLEYREQVEVPAIVAREACPKHGKRKNIVACGADCTCDEAPDILLMPEAEALKGVDRAHGNLDQVVDQLSNFFDDNDVLWSDPKPDNLLRWNGEIVACDFGRPDL